MHALFIALSLAAAPVSAASGSVDYGVAIDASGASRRHLNDLIAAGRALVAGAGPEDRGFVVSFGGKGKMALKQRKTSDPALLGEALDDAFAEGDRPALLDGASLGAAYFDQEMGPADRPRVLVVLSGGDEGPGSYSLAEVDDSLARAGVSLFALVVSDEETPPALKTLESLAARSGGRVFRSRDAAGLIAAVHAAVKRHATARDGYPQQWALDAEQKKYPNAGFVMWIKPSAWTGDFDGDGVEDTAFTVIENLARKEGIAIVHGGADARVTMLGAGVPFAGMDRLVEFVACAKGKKSKKSDTLRLTRKDGSGGVVYWNGKSYAWKPFKAPK